METTQWEKTQKIPFQNKVSTEKQKTLTQGKPANRGPKHTGIW